MRVVMSLGVFLVWLLVASTPCAATGAECATQISPPDYLTEVLDVPCTYPHIGANVVLRVYVHRTYEPGVLPYTDAEIESMFLPAVEAAFRQRGVYFLLTGIDEVNFRAPGSCETSGGTTFPGYRAGAINLYIGRRAPSDLGDNGAACGEPAGALSVRTNCEVLPQSNCEEILVHELGHALGLHHIEGTPCPEPVVDGCCAYDYVCDTQGTQYWSTLVAAFEPDVIRQADCAWDLSDPYASEPPWNLDACVDPLPDIANIMYQDQWRGCRTHVTPGQGERILSMVDHAPVLLAARADVYGDIPAIGNEVTWSGTVVVNGDIRVPVGTTLRIDAGTKIRLASEDILLPGGADPGVIAWTIAGSVIAEGTPTEPIVFEPYSDAPGEHWGRVTVLENQGQSLVFENVIFNELLAPLSVADAVVSPNGGDQVYEGDAVEVTWTTTSSYVGTAPDREIRASKVDLLLSTDGGVSYPTALVLGAPNTGSYTWTPEAIQATTSARVRVVFYHPTGVEVGADASDASFTVVALRGFVDLSGETGLDYAGTPYSAIAFDYDQDGDQDLMISQSDNVGMLYARNFLSNHGAPALFRKNDDAFESGSEPAYALRGLSFASFDGDAFPDVFAAHQTNPQLFRNKGPQAGGEVKFENLADSLGVLGWGVGSWAGSWGHFDGDGKIDLLIARRGSPGGMQPQTAGSPLPLVLLRNNITSQLTGAFESVGDTSGIAPSGDAGLDARTAAWADFDGDGDQDIFVGSRGSEASRLYVNQGDWTFDRVDVAAPSFTAVTAVTWADLDKDAALDLDLVVALATDVTGSPHLVWYENQNGVLAPPITLDSGFSRAEGVHVLDADLDGLADILVLPATGDPGAGPHLLLQQAGPGGPTFVDGTASFGLDTATGGVGGAAVARFDDDNRPDLYLGRPVTAAGKYYYRNLALGTAPLATTVSLQGGCGGNDRYASGAVVKLLHNGQPVGVQIVDGGSGRGTQGAHDLVFVTDEGGLYEVETTWMEGHVQRDTLLVDQMNVIRDETDPGIIPSSMTCQYLPGPNGTATLTFTWFSAKLGRQTFDEVVASSTAGCLPAPVTYRAVDENVELSLSKQGGVWVHTFTVYDVPCIPNCVYSWYCRTSTDFKTSSTVGNPKTYKTKVCAQ